MFRAAARDEGEIITISFDAMGSGVEELGLIDLLPDLWDFGSRRRNTRLQKVLRIACCKMPLSDTQVYYFRTTIGIADSS